MPDPEPETVVITGRYMPEHPLDRLLRSCGTDAPNSERLALFWRYYEEHAGVTLSRPPTNTERAAALDWLNRANDDSWPGFLHKVPSLQAMLHRTVAEKASTLVQLPCPACELGDDSQGLAFNFAVGMTPWTAQARSDRVVLRETVSAALQAKQSKPPYWETGDVCATIIALVPAANAQQDVDNLAKGLLDALQGYVYENDRQVQCLTVRRLPYSGSQGCYFVRVSPAAPVINDVIYDSPKRPNLSWSYIGEPIQHQLPSPIEDEPDLT